MLAKNIAPRERFAATSAPPPGPHPCRTLSTLVASPAAQFSELLNRSPSKRGIPKCPRRCNRSVGLRFPASVTSVRLLGLSSSTTPPRTLVPSTTSQTSAFPLRIGPPVLSELTRCFQPRR